RGMSENDDLLRFAADFQQEVLSAAEVEGEETFRADAFTREMIGVLTDAGEIDDGEACYHHARGVEVSGYSISLDELTLSAMVSIFTRSAVPTAVGKADAEAAIRRLANFVERALRGQHLEMEQASPQYDMSLRIHELRGRIANVRLYLLTDGLVNSQP